MTPRPRVRSSVLALAAAIVALLALGASAASAAAPHSWWHLTMSSTPSNLAPGGTAILEVDATNLGDATAGASVEHPITIKDTLPEGLSVASTAPSNCKVFKTPSEPVCDHLFPLKPGELPATPKCEGIGTHAECTYVLPVQPYQRVELDIEVNVAATSSHNFEGEENTLKVEGGEAKTNEVTEPVTISAATTAFGVERYAIAAEDEEGEPETRAGVHPFQFTTSFQLNQVFESFGENGILPSTPQLLRNLHVNLPPGFVGDANKQIVPQCTEHQFQTVLRNNESNQCPEDTAVGVAVVSLTEPDGLRGQTTIAAPVYNLVPAEGEPARFGFLAALVPVTLDTAVDGGDYHVVVNVNNASKAPALMTSLVTIWGVPGDEHHDISRGSQCLIEGNLLNEGESCTLLKEPTPPPFLTMPTYCEKALQTSTEPQSWAPEAEFLGAVHTRSSIELKECDKPPFTPSITVTPIQHTSSTPTGLHVKLTLPQATTLEREGRAEAELRNSVVTLPAGVQLSPSAANGLGEFGCSTAEVGYKGANPLTGTQEFAPEVPRTEESEANVAQPLHECPRKSKVGVVKIKTPILEHELSGGVYLASQEDNPFHSLFALYIIVKDPFTGADVKIPGEVKVEPNGEIKTSFANAPQLPFEELELELFDGRTASVATPPSCGAFKTHASFTAWTGASVEETLAGSQFEITSCAGSPQPFAPIFHAGPHETQAGALTTFTLTLTRELNEEGKEKAPHEQQPTALTTTLPPGMAGYLSKVVQCPELQAEEGTCGEGSLIGHVTAVSGLGPAPFTVNGGRVYITGPYKGAPFGLTIVIPANAGPFHLGNVITRSTISVDPNTAALTIKSELPKFVSTKAHANTGVPVQLRAVVVTVERPNNAPFQFNPTNCSPQTITGSVSGDEGGTETLSEPLQVTGCEKLAFSPQLTAETNSTFTKLQGTSLKVVVTATPGQANIAKTKIAFPEQLPSRLTTIHQACPEATFNANPASCDEGSNIGMAIAHTPVLNSPLVGPAYLVSHGGAAFPDAEFVLQGEGITLVLDGKTDIKHGVTTSAFESVPDAPVSTFEVVLPAGPHSAFTGPLNAGEGKESLCTETTYKTVTKIVKKGKKKVKKKVKEPVVSELHLKLPTTITGQNGDVIEEKLPLKVSGCPVLKKSTAAKPKPKPKKKKKKKKK